MTKYGEKHYCFQNKEMQLCSSVTMLKINKFERRVETIRYNYKMNSKRVEFQQF